MKQYNAPYLQRENFSQRRRRSTVINYMLGELSGLNSFSNMTMSFACYIFIASEHCKLSTEQSRSITQKPIACRKVGGDWPCAAFHHQSSIQLKNLVSMVYCHDHELSDQTLMQGKPQTYQGYSSTWDGSDKPILHFSKHFGVVETHVQSHYMIENNSS